MLQKPELSAGLMGLLACMQTLPYLFFTFSKFSSLLVFNCDVLTFSGVLEDKMSVLLYDTTGAQDVCINEFLVLNGFCQTAGLG